MKTQQLWNEQIPATMQAAVMHKTHEIKIEERSVPNISDHDVLVKVMITDRYPLEKTQEAMNRAITNKSGSLKVVVYPNGLIEEEHSLCLRVPIKPCSIHS